MFFDHYPYTNFHNVNLDWVLQAVKSWGAMVEANNQAFIDLKAANTSFKEYVTHYLQNLDVSDEINDKLDQMLADGVLAPYMAPYIQSDVSAWLTQHITPTTPAVDRSLTISGAAADAAVTGEKISQIKEDLIDLQGGGYIADQQKISEKINSWLNEHPEATTTVQDGSLTEAKLSDTLKKLVLNDYVTPEMFGAIGDGVADDTTSISNCIKTAYTEGKNVMFLHNRYVVKGDNPCGLERVIPSDDRATTERNVIIDFNNATIYYYPNNVDDCFAFVGYCRYSIIKNLHLSVYPPSGKNNYGDIFTTRFKISGAPHEFSHNYFFNITVSGSFRRMFSFECGSNERDTHDDLSVFEEVNASGFVCYCYIDHSNSVSNSFKDCSITLNVDNAIGFYVNTSSWASGLRVINNHITIMSCDNAKILKTICSETPYGVIYFDRTRLELRDTATNWMYFDMRGGVAYFGNMFSNIHSTYSLSNVYGIMDYKASVSFAESEGIYTPFSMIGGALSSGIDAAVEALIFNHCSFVNGDTYNARRAYPIINYCDTSGTLISDRTTALQNYSYGNILVQNCTDRRGSYSRGDWLDDYNISNGRCGVLDCETHEKIWFLRSANGVYTCCNTNIVIPYSIVITSFKYTNTQYNISALAKSMRITFLNKEHTDIVASSEASKSLELIGSGKELYIPAGTIIKINMYNDNTVVSEGSHIKSSWVNIRYRLPSTPIDIERCESVTYKDSYGFS